ncbi:hypothetical protein GYMLUDRAFT_252300 [Collybiopsis luxurians FD-317 M1]|uniref:Uncharacterized protein n=1 Tax=Collybiopsis luxurians FD-317 M1 TaxID=944289 RepID=A0A0D0ALT4_9AGAR|nr:hypothetical protein GYMLUDRAFT_252300 [Collybiopsis luxurians FD-317 M1]
MDLPENLDSIPALCLHIPSTPSSHHCSDVATTPSVSSEFPVIVGSPSDRPNVTTSGSRASQARLSTITKALTECSEAKLCPDPVHDSLSPSHQQTVTHCSLSLHCPTCSASHPLSLSGPRVPVVSFDSHAPTSSNFPDPTPNNMSSFYGNMPTGALSSVTLNISFQHSEDPLSNQALFNDGGLGADGCPSSDLMAPELIDTYQNVKNRLMPLVYPIASAGVPTDKFDWLSFSEVFSGLSLPVHRSLLTTVIFSHCTCWINPSRADPLCVTVVNTDKGPQLTPAEDSHFTAIFLTSSVVKHSCIYDPMVFESGQTKQVLHQLDLSLFGLEVQLMLGFFASALNFTEIALAVSEGVVTFSSMQHFANEVKSNPTDYSPSTQSSYSPLYPKFPV